MRRRGAWSSLLPASRARPWPSGSRCWSRSPCWPSRVGARGRLRARRRRSTSSSKPTTGSRRSATGYVLGVDGIALALIVLTAVLVPLLILAGWNDASDQIGLGGAVDARLLRADAGRRGHGDDLARLAADVLLFYVFFEAMLIPMYFLIGGFGGDRTRVQRGGEVPAVQPVRRADHAGRGHRPVRGDRAERRVRGGHLRLPRDRGRGVERSARDEPGGHERCCSSASSSRSRSRRRCGRSTPGCPTPRWRRPRPAPC